MVEAYFDGVVSELVVSPAVSSFVIVKRLAGDEEGYQRIKCLLSSGGLLELSEYVTVDRNKLHIGAYSYHWQDSHGCLVKRWDNVPHHKEIKSFPRHIHLPDETVVSSPGMHIKKVLAEVEKSYAAGRS